MQALNLHGKVSLFPEKIERWNLVLGIIFLVPVIYLFCLHSGPPTDAARFYARMIVGTVFLNSAHSGFSLLMLFLVPEFREWALHKAAGKKFRRAVFIALFILGILLFGVLYRAQPFTLHEDWLHIGLLMLVLIQGAHITGQFRGLAALYNHEAEKQLSFTAQELEKKRRHDRIEGKLFSALIAHAMLVAYLSFDKGINNKYPWAFSFAIGLGIILSLGLLLNAQLTPKSAQSNKRIYLLRTLFAPMIVGSFWARTALKAIHGTEYFFVFLQVRRNSRWQISALAFTLITLAIGVTVFAMTLPINNPTWFDHWWKEILVCTYVMQFFFEYTHYYLDSILFRFRDPELRRHIGPLLAAPKFRATEPVTS